MKRKILFFLVALLFLGCESDRIQQSDAEDYDTLIYGLVAELQHEADSLGVEFGTEKAHNLRTALLDPSITRDQADALLIQAKMGIVTEYQHRLKEEIEKAIKFHTPYVEEAIDWKFTELERLANDPQVDPPIQALALDMYIELALKEASLLQSFKDRLWEELDGMKLPVNGELVKCWKRCGRGYEARYKKCSALDPPCWDNALAWYIACICACPGRLDGAQQ